MTVPGIIAELCLTAGAFEFEADDSFTRADAGSLGTADSRQLWVEDAGTGGIVSNKAYFSALEGGKAHASVRSIANGDVGVTLSTIADGCGVKFRQQDASNYWKTVKDGSNWKTYLVENDVATLKATAAGAVSNGTNVTVRAVGVGVEVPPQTERGIRVYINGSPIGSTITDATFASSPMAGIYAESTAARFDDFSASFVWTDITPYLCGEVGKVGISAQRGRQHELSQMETGTCDVLLQNDDRRFDPTYEDSPYWPFLLPYRRIRLTPTLDDVPYRRLFTGHIERWPLQYLMPATDGIVKVTAVDRLAVIGSGLWDVYPDVVLGMDPDAYWRMGAA